MCRLNESIKVRNNALCNISFHNERLNVARSELFNAIDIWDLQNIITLPELDINLIYKCRVVYGNKVESIEFLPYKPKNIKFLKLIKADDIDYTYKYNNRQFLDDLKKNAIHTPDMDILIVKNGFITDTSFSNIVFFDGRNWFTPATPLLKGTKRAFYLKNKIISEAEIQAGDLKNFKKARLINAMLDLENGMDINIENIVH